MMVFQCSCNKSIYSIDDVYTKMRIEDTFLFKSLSTRQE